MGIVVKNLGNFVCNCCGKNTNPTIKVEEHSSFILCFDCAESINDIAEEYVTDIASGKPAVDKPSLIPNRAVEFAELDIKDSIQLGDRIEYIHHWEQDKITQQKKISFMVGDDFNQLTQYEYIMQGWRKVNDQEDN